MTALPISPRPTLHALCGHLWPFTLFTQRDQPCLSGTLRTPHPEQHVVHMITEGEEVALILTPHGRTHFIQSLLASGATLTEDRPGDWSFYWPFA